MLKFNFTASELNETFANLDESSESDKQDNLCPICITNQCNRITFCQHEFCKSCIYEWVGTHSSSCPVCRTRLNRYNIVEAYDPTLESDDDEPNDLSESVSVPTHEYIEEIRQVNLAAIELFGLFLQRSRLIDEFERVAEQIN